MRFLFFVLVPLDKPEEFLSQIHKMDHFAERLECWLYRNKFTETLTAIGELISWKIWSLWRAYKNMYVLTIYAFPFY